jgi:hypothetical protein
MKSHTPARPLALRPRKARAARLASTPRRWTRLGARTALGRADWLRLYPPSLCELRRAGSRSFSRLGRCRVFPMSGFSAPIISNARTPHRMRPRPGVAQRAKTDLASLVHSHPAAFQVPFPPSSVDSTRRKPSLQTRPPKAAGQFAPTAWPAEAMRRRLRRSNHHGHLPFRRQKPAGRSSRSRARHRLGCPASEAGWPSLGSGRWPSAVRLRRVHSARSRHAIPMLHRDVMPVALRSVHGMR